MEIDAHTRRKHSDAEAARRYRQRIRQDPRKYYEYKMKDCMRKRRKRLEQLRNVLGLRPLKGPEKSKSYWEQVKSNPLLHERRKMSAREGMRKLRAQRKAQYLQWLLHSNSLDKS
ncbi:hypothetical protein ACOMHN_022958 [Nucella lapillus]